MVQYEIDGIKVEVIREAATSDNQTVFARLTTLINNIKNEDAFSNKEDSCKIKSSEMKT